MHFGFEDYHLQVGDENKKSETKQKHYKRCNKYFNQG